jgi:hypothetical protein
MPKLGRKTPCIRCPWRIDSRRGYLGEDEPESFYRGAITNENAWPCHEQIDYSDPDWLERQVPDADICAGQLIYFRNDLKLPRDPELNAAVLAVHMSKRVFWNSEQFMRHHMPGADEETIKRMAKDAKWPYPQGEDSQCQ